MNALARKEIGLLLPAWWPMLLAATAPGWFVLTSSSVAASIFLLSVLALALRPFGMETENRTFGLLLVQPVERRRVWNLKAGLVIVALFLGVDLFAFCWWFRGWPIIDLIRIGGVVLLGLSGGLWTTLLFREMAVSFLVTVIAPFAIYALTLLCRDRFPFLNSDSPAFPELVLTLYAVGGFVLARHLFLNAQDVPWTGPKVQFPTWRGKSDAGVFEFKRRPNRWVALVKKELQLQGALLSVMMLLAGLHVLALIGRHFIPSWNTEITGFMMPAMGVFFVPLLTGGAAVAEERHLNTLESSLCLPFRKRTLFLIKFLSAMLIGITLGGVVPAMLIDPASWKEFIIPATLFTFGAFYASTLTRSLLQAIPATIGVAAAIFSVGALVVSLLGRRGAESFIAFYNNRIYADFWIPTVLIATLWCARINFGRLRVGWQVWVGDFAKILGAGLCSCALAFGVYERSWELFQSFEPVHGPARLSGTVSPQICRAGNSVGVLLPDGRIWSGKLNDDRFSEGRFTEGNRWMQMAMPDATAIAALRNDGTLWRISGNRVTQIGSDHDWKKIVADGVLIGLKNDGSAWHGLTLDALERLEDCPPLTDVFLLDQSIVGLRSDGSVWQRQFKFLQTAGYKPPTAGWKIGGTNIMAVAGGPARQLVLHEDGSIWAKGYLPGDILGLAVGAGRRTELTQISGDSRWAGLAGTFKLVAVRKDGAFWAMDFGRSTEPSRNRDWMVANQSDSDVCALARDGTLSVWSQMSLPYSNWLGLADFYLRPTRKTVSINIIDTPGR